MTPISTTGVDGDRFTAAALRTLTRAGRIAAEWSHLAVQPPHVLQALVEDESHAAGVLEELGFDPRTIELLLTSLPTTGYAAHYVLDPIDPPRSGDVELVLLEATRFARLSGPDGTVGTEHLLFGLAVVESPVSETLVAHDLDEAAALRRARGPGTPVGDPLPVDFEIHFEEIVAPGERVDEPEPDDEPDGVPDDALNEAEPDDDVATLTVPRADADLVSWLSAPTEVEWIERVVLDGDEPDEDVPASSSGTSSGYERELDDTTPEDVDVDEEAALEERLLGGVDDDEPAPIESTIEDIEEIEVVEDAGGDAEVEVVPPEASDDESPDVVAVLPEASGPEAERSPSIDVLRVVDAAANRAREGLRVAEDHARFLLDDVHLVETAKSLRHDLADVLRTLDQTALLRARDTHGDVGRTVTTDAEHRRDEPADVLRAALKRAEEALRSLEEFGKALDPAIGPRFEALRYRLYALEKSALTTAAAREHLAGRDLYLLLTRDLCKHDPEFVLRQALLGGVSIVQVREKSLPDRELLDWCRVVRRLTREADALFVMNDRPDLALLCDADGVHVGQEELGVREARRVLGPDRLVGVSTHDLEQAHRAVDDGADYIGVGPTFPSGTKSFDAFAGLDFVRAVAEEIGLPAYAIGGIDGSNVADVVAAGGRRIAVTGAVCSAGDPAAAAERLAGTLAEAP